MKKKLVHGAKGSYRTAEQARKAETPKSKSKSVTLSREEAAVLHTILSGIGGCPDRSKRRVADRIDARLEHIFGTTLPTFKFDGDIWFQDECLALDTTP